MGIHTSHPDVVKRLKRAEGHLRSVIAMIEEGRACVDIAQQLQAVESAISNAKTTLIHDHIDHCLEQSLRNEEQSPTSAIKELKSITKYL
ncbi:Copper-sensing transcriptional repressor CsoR [Caballeronia novacaledonica]|uniref:Copper-sensing transcriptional repressor CsoR n=1 Tax=Caballeronia novacaledonica TaxID=1544861 RepID=A0A2U3I1X1_9BURK|nr:metal-sensing transcriptional repressor [Caballeronia novacaledonica]SPB14117.1 Copper-sensing transcriptional repressor CsoR [Caballeronia novacaledonica]